MLIIPRRGSLALTSRNIASNGSAPLPPLRLLKRNRERTTNLRRNWRLFMAWPSFSHFLLCSTLDMGMDSLVIMKQIKSSNCYILIFNTCDQ